MTNGNEGVLQTCQSSKTGASPSDIVEYHTQDTLQEVELAYSKPYSQSEP